MSTKKRIVLNRVVSLTLGIVCTAAGYNRSDLLFYMGVSLLAVSIALCIKYAVILRDPERLKNYEIACRDERNLHIARKSYAVSFFVSIYAEVAAFIFCAYRNLDIYADIFSYMILLQMAVYLIARACLSRSN